jgi:hypothetical protein
LSINKIYSNKESFILNNLAKGKTREEIATLLGYKTWRSLDIYMRRTGAKWDSDQNTYVPLEKKNGNCKIYDIEKIIENAEPKIANIISRFTKENADPLQIAKDCGFSDHRALSSYMKSKGYQWSVEINNYIDTPIHLISEKTEEKEEENDYTENTHANEENINIQKYLALLELLYKNKEKFIDMVGAESQPGTIPRYTVPGITRTKSFYMSDRLSRLVTEFSETRNISQKEIIEAAIIEFLRNHSYKEEIDQLLGRI